MTPYHHTFSSPRYFSPFPSLRGIVAKSWKKSIQSSNYQVLHSKFVSTCNGKLPQTYVCNGISNGILPYTKGWAWQQTVLQNRFRIQRMQQIIQNEPFNTNDEQDETIDNDIDRDYLLFFEHTPVYTLGRGADENNLTFLDKEPDGGEKSRRSLSRKSRGKGSARLSIDKTTINSIGDVNNHLAVQELMGNISDTIFPVIAPNGTPIYRIERGGEVTFHGPGQLVAYPLLLLKREPYTQDLHWYLRMVEEVIIRTLSNYNIHTVRDEINTGVWVNEKKIAAVGVSASKWITTHGFAINVSPDLSFFDTSVIIPCGIVGRGVTSIAELMHEQGEGENCPTVEEVASVVRLNFEHVFGVKTLDGDILK